MLANLNKKALLIIKLQEFGTPLNVVTKRAKICLKTICTLIDLIMSFSDE